MWTGPDLALAKREAGERRSRFDVRYPVILVCCGVAATFFVLALWSDQTWATSEPTVMMLP
jgi:hypothetical protein